MTQSATRQDMGAQQGIGPLRRRVIELADGKIVRDEQAGAYASRESTREFAIRMRSAQG